MRFFSVVIAFAAVVLHGCKDTKKSKSKKGEENITGEGEEISSTESGAKTSVHTQV